MRWRSPCAAVLLVAGLATSGAQPASAQGGADLTQLQRPHLDDVHPGVGGERVTELHLRAMTRFGIPVRRLPPQAIEVWEDGERIDVEDVTLEPLEATGRAGDGAPAAPRVRSTR